MGASRSRGAGQGGPGLLALLPGRFAGRGATPTGRPRSPISLWLARLRHGRSEQVNHISLGTFCHAAAGLRNAGLRLWAGPFDWIFSSPAMAAECLRDDFRSLFDPARLESVPASELTNGAKRQCRHPLYETRFSLPIIFNHHDPDASAGDLRRLQRGVARFRDALASRGRNMLYMVSERAWPDDEISELTQVLAGYSSDNTLIVVTLEAGEGARQHHVSEAPGPGCRRIDVAVQVSGRSLGAAFPDPGDDAYLADVLRQVASGIDPTLKGHN